ncbi:MAG: flippase-like domain-containing protein [Flavobacteriales bacterium]|nr:flippase-like domain-containing protein [Flavobacteriales bacterium]
MIGLFALVYIVYKVKTSIDENDLSLVFSKVRIVYLTIAFLLMFINWGLETYKWRTIIESYFQIKFWEAFKIVITGIMVSIISPNRVAEIPARVFLLDTNTDRKQLIWLTSFNAMMQLLCTLIIGTVGIILTQHLFNLSFLNYSYLTILLSVSFVVLLFLFIPKLKKLIKLIPFVKNWQSLQEISISYNKITYIFLLSMIRYLVFCIQFYLVLKAFNIHLNNDTELFFIPVTFIFASIIPTILLSEIGVRTSVAVFVFGLVSNDTVSIIAASLSLWLINIAIPALMGIFNFKQIRFR